MKVEALSLPLYEHPSTSRPLYAHQVAVLDAWGTSDTFLIITRTGTGKTLAAMLPILHGRLFAVAVYPTNELIRDQVRAVARMAEEEGLIPYVREPAGETDREGLTRADVVLTPLDGVTLEQWRKQRHRAWKGQALDDVLTLGKRPGTCSHIVFVNPDILFLLLAARYRSGEGGLASLQSYEVLVVDEFHLYQGVELAHALFMAHFARSFGSFHKILLLSATPPPEVRDLLVRLWSPTAIDADVVTSRPQIGSRVAVHDVTVTPVHQQSDTVAVLESEVRQRVAYWRELRGAKPDPTFLPGVVILNSVVNAIWLEDRLRQSDLLKSEELLIVRGLSHRDIRRRTGSEIAAIGTSAIEVGIDFNCACLVFEASDAPSLLQRFGRAGRHGPGEAALLAPANVHAGIAAQPARIDRSAFESKVYQWYPSAQVRPWFVETLCGWYSVRSIARGLVRRVQEDHHGNAQAVKLVERHVETALDDFAKRLGGQNAWLNARSREHFAQADAGRRYQWLTTYERLGTFRTSLPSIWVYDGREARRRHGDTELGKYQADLKTLLHRGYGLKWQPSWRTPDGNDGVVTVQGYGKWQPVHVACQFNDDDTFRFFETEDTPDMLLSQAGRHVAISDIMLKRNHIFTVVKGAAVDDKIDWRLPIFPSGEFLIAFDGAALLLYEMAQRAQ